MNAPRSSAAAPVQSRWSLIRDSSPMITRMYWQRLVSSMPEQLLDRVVPGHLVHRRADVVLAVGDRDVLVEVQVLAELLEPRVQVADVGRRLDDPLAVELQDQAQGRVRGGVLRARS